MKLLVKKAKSSVNSERLISLTEAEFNSGNLQFSINTNETPVIKFTDTNELYLIDDLQKSLEYFTTSEILIPITLENLIPLTVLPSNLVLSKEYKAKVTNILDIITSGLLEIGEKYTIDVLQVGDDFSNVGYIEEGTSFIATGTTPTSWTNGTEVLYSYVESIDAVNTTGGSITIEITSGNTSRIICSEPIFLDLNKILVYPIENNTNVSIIDDNTLELTNILYGGNVLIVEVYD